MISHATDFGNPFAISFSTEFQISMKFYKINHHTLQMRIFSLKLYSSKGHLYNIHISLSREFYFSLKKLLPNPEGKGSKLCYSCSPCLYRETCCRQTVYSAWCVSQYVRNSALSLTVSFCFSTSGNGTTQPVRRCVSPPLVMRTYCLLTVKAVPACKFPASLVERKVFVLGPVYRAH